jgi:hypothetical protein
VKPRRLLLLLLALLALAGTALLRTVLRSEDPASPGKALPAARADDPEADAGDDAAEPAHAARAAATPLHPLAITFGDGTAAPEAEPAVLLEILEGYRRLRGAFPTAEDNAALMRRLTGRAPDSLAVFPEAHPRLDDSGALVDAWGTPFFFHHLSSQALEVRSAGPDREFYTDDDLTAPPPREGP